MTARNAIIGIARLLVLLVRTRSVGAHSRAPLRIVRQITTSASDGLYSAGPAPPLFGRLKGA